MLMIFQGPNYYGLRLGQAVSPRGCFRHIMKRSTSRAGIKTILQPATLLPRSPS